MLRLLCAVLFLVCTSVVQGQYYIDDVESESVDNLKILGDSLYAAGDYKASSESFKYLRDHWLSKKEKDDATDVQFQNYIFSEVYYRKVLFKIGERTSSMDKLNELVHMVEARLGNDHLINGCLYHELGLMITMATDKYQEAHDYTYRAMLIREKQLPEYKKDLGWSYNNLYIITRQQKDLDHAETYLFKALRVREQIDPPDPSMMLVTYVNLSQLQLIKGDWNKEVEYLKKAQEAGSALDVDHPYNLMVKTTLSKAYYREGKFKESLQMNKDALAGRRIQLSGESQVELLDNYSSIINNYTAIGYKDSASLYLDSVFYLRQKYNHFEAITFSYQAKARLESNPDKAIEVLKEALQNCPKDPQCFSDDEAMTNRMISDKYLDKDDSYQALIYALRSKELFEADTISNSRWLPQLYYSLANIYYSFDQKDDAIAYLKEAIRLNDKNSYISESWKVANLRFLASIYSDQGEYADAKLIYDRIEKILIDAPTMTDGNKRDIYRFISIHYQDQGDKDRAIEYALKAKSLMAEENGPHYFDGLTFLRLYHVHKDAGYTDKARQYFIDACHSMGVKSWTDYNFEKPEVELLQSPDFLNGTIDIYKYFDKVFELNASQRQEMISAILSMIDHCRQLYFYQSSEQELEFMVKRFYDLAIADLYELYEEHQDPSLIKSTIEVIEKSRSININRALNQDNLAAKHGLPTDMQSEEKRISFLSERAFQEYGEAKDLDKNDDVAELVDQMNKLALEKDSFVTLLKNNYPSYYRDRYVKSNSSIDDIIDLSKKQKVGFVNYYWTSKKLYSIFINGDQLEFYEVEYGEIEKPLKSLMQAMVDRDGYFSELAYDEQISDFIEKATSLHAQLLPSEIYKQLPDELVIIPDGKLLNFPFEILLHGNVTAESYRSLPYMIKEKVISYNGSLSQYVQTAQSAIKKDYIGFAPTYPDTEPLIAARSNSDVVLSPLIFNQEEVEQSAAIFEGQSFTSEAATESNFKELIIQPGILHLAMHTSLNDRIPLDSYLSFTSEREDSDTNGSLYAHEIAQMNINADLVVLSACATNIGKKVNGEAVRGIAKAFYMASCPNLILSNWLVDDKSSNRIIIDFFNEMTTRKTPAESLREAKLSYLNKSSEVQSHPYYWAAYSYYGSSTMIESDGWRRWIWLLFALMSFLLIILVVKRI